MIAAVILIFISVFFITFSISYTISHKEKPVDRLKQFDEDYAAPGNEKYKAKEKMSLLKRLSQMLPKFKFNNSRAKKIENDLAAADIPVTYEELLIIKMISSASICILSLAASKDIIIAAAAFIIVWSIPALYIKLKKDERIKLFDDELNDGIMIISNSLKAGYSFLQAVSVVCEETRDPFAKEFKKLLKEMSLGIAEKEALMNLLNRVASDNLKLVITAILIQKDTGGNLAEILDNIGETIRERKKIKDELKTLTAQGRLSGMIITLLPVILGGVIYVMNKSYVSVLFTTKIGLVMISITVVGEILGFIFIRKIVDIDL